MLRQIICSGQTGAERAALDAALELKFPHGGFCLRGRLAEDGHIHCCYQLEDSKSDPLSVVNANVEYSDASVIFYQAFLTKTLESTLLHAIEQGRPYKLIDMEYLSPEQAAGCLEGFVQAHELELLNITGPTANDCPQAYDYVLQVINRLLHCYRPLSLDI